MFRRISRRPRIEPDVRYCEPCGEVSTARDRARRHYDRTQALAHAWLLH
jgi:hypothetical protein